ncbi:AAA domain-containing protein [Virgisporangium aurantiacum]|uniref:AAA domain-containing protein n=1 Tax=Virgisporangium aurantiacum TaxID=175570 RepID=A0A8J4E4H1_9ACTN|nr:AAA domain-containing protein [Virgisporangium aurantiacum]GIJ61945.1 hypothetical protein Vau01_094610 [Virgisporangium aurantiacum]
MDDGRTAKVAAAVGRWSEQLMDVAGRNALLHYRDLKVGTLDLARADGTARGAMATGRTVPLARLFPDPQAHADAVKRARAIRNKARELYEERGIETCYLAMGSATWTNPKGGAVPVAPVLLRSAVLRAHGAAEEDFDLTVTADAEVNPVLVHVLGTEFDVRFDAELVADLEPAEAFERIAKEAAGRVRGFAISAREVIGTFSYAKLPMVTDLAAAVDALTDHEVVAAIAGDAEAQTAVRVPAGVGGSDPDSLPPSAEFLVLDADSSQHAAIDAVLSGQHAVIKGPPGTGKSQTIANLITSLVARGKRVLFVAEKRAAITAVTDRLARRGLGQLVMDVHDGTSARRRIAADLKSAYESAARTALPDLAELHGTLVDRRSRLAEHVIALHEPREPWGVSVFEAQSALLASPPPLPVRLRGSPLLGVTEVVARQVREALREYASLGGLGPAASPWHESTVHSGEQAQEAWLAAGRLANATRALEPVFAALESVGLARPQRLVELRSARALVDGVTATLLRFDPAVYDEPLADLVAACADQAWRSANGVHIGWWKARRLRQRAAALGRAEMDRDELFHGLLAAHGQRQRWPSTPRLPAEWDAVRRVHDRVETDITTLDACLPAVDLTTLAWPDLTAYAARLAADDRALRRQPHRLQLAAQLADAGVQEIVDALRTAPDVNPVDAFDAVWHASIVEHVGFLDARIGGFDAVAQERIVSEYRAADAAHLDSSARRVLRAVAEHIVAVRERFPEQDRLVEHQASLKRRHLPMRQLFATAPNVLTALKPCWAMSPLVVSQLLPADGQYFDVVIFDEASQVTPADAVPAILRARQVVVAGDEHQLPPTAFFAAATDGDGAVGVTADGAIDLSLTSGYESILDVLTALLPAYMLRWHYRSRDDRLIGFSNEWIYDRSLVTFPGTASVGRLTHVLVSSGISAADDPESAPSEVDRVVALVLAHASERPRESLGVIAMGVTHADRIDRALRLALAGRPELHGFFAENTAEPFFVKNLERVQGDERDAIILSVGYGKTADGRLLYRFGPLLTAGGERRLNVAITRARGRMTVVSSFSAADMDPARTTGRGVALLREYLRYAALGGAVSAVATTDPVPLTPFDRDVLDRLTAAGVPVLPRYGLSGQHIEFAAAHPTRPDRMALAVETDGPVYRAAGTVRDRDRLRPTQLERLGWRVHRIWSTDWFTDPEPEVARAVSAYHDAILDLDPPEPAPVVVPEPAVPPEPPALPEPPVVPEPVAAPEDPPATPVAPAAPAAPDVAESGRPRTGRPPVPVGLPIAGYRHADLVALIRWIESDTLLRTEDEVLEEVMRELGFSRKGPRIREAISRALAAARATR